MDTAAADRAPADARTDSSRRRPSELLWWAVAAALVLVIGVSGTDSTYALWREQADVTGPVIGTGTAHLTADWSETEESKRWDGMLPGESTLQQVTVTNHGDVSMALNAHSVTSAPALEMRIAGGEPQQELRTSPLGGEEQPILALGAPATPLVLGPGESAQLTLELTATDALEPSSTVAFTVVIDGEQTR